MVLSKLGVGVKQVSDQIQARLGDLRADVAEGGSLCLLASWALSILG